MLRVPRLTLASFSLLLACTVGGGCRVESHNSGGKNDDDVKVATPFGHVQLNTNPAAVKESVGLSMYPGATPEKQNNGNDTQADINFSFGRFKLRVKAMSFLTPDPMDKVEAFYRKDLQRYGTVIACAGNKPIAEPVRTPEGLTCDEDKESHGAVHANTSSSLELKTGSKQHQHVVGLEKHGDQTKIGLVALDLPGGDHFGGGSDDGDGDSRQ